MTTNIAARFAEATEVQMEALVKLAALLDRLTASYRELARSAGLVARRDPMTMIEFNSADHFAERVSVTQATIRAELIGAEKFDPALNALQHALMDEGDAFDGTFTQFLNSK